MLGMMHMPAQALPYLEQALELYRSLGDKRRINNVLQHLGHASLALSDHDHAEAFLAESVQLGRETGDPSFLVMSLSQLGMVVWLRGDYSRA